MSLIYLSQFVLLGPRLFLEVSPPRRPKERTMASIRTRRRTARPLMVCGDVHLDMKVASWEVELVAAELTSITDRVDGEQQRAKGRRQRHAAG